MHLLWLEVSFKSHLCYPIVEPTLQQLPVPNSPFPSIFQTQM
jgi:hypothetical protein